MTAALDVIAEVRRTSLPLKCYGNFPLIMLPDGRVRRMLPTAFIAVGGQAWSVGWGLSGIEAGGEYDIEELERPKALGGNTWDAPRSRSSRWRLWRSTCSRT